MLHVNVTTLLNPQALQIDPANTKALYRRAQGWQGIKDLDQALVMITIFNNNYYFNINIETEHSLPFLFLLRLILKRLTKSPLRTKVKIKLFLRDSLFEECNKG